MLDSFERTNALWSHTKDSWSRLWSFRAFFNSYSLYTYYEAHNWAQGSSGLSSYGVGLLRELFRIASFILQMGLFIGREILLAAAVLILSLGTILSFIVEGLGAVYASMTTARALSRQAQAPVQGAGTSDEKKSSLKTRPLTLSFTMERSAAYIKAKSLHQTPYNHLSPTMYCPEAVLLKFREILEGSSILGSSYQNPYTGYTELFPSSAKDLTAIHLHILARNESANVTGWMKTELYRGLLSTLQIAQIRCLVKFTTVVGAVMVKSYGGYPKQTRSTSLSPTIAAIVIDQAGYQWQSSFFNTGSLFFTPDDPNPHHMPEDFVSFTESMRQACLPPAKSESTDLQPLSVTWRVSKTSAVPGTIHLDDFQRGIACEFTTAFQSLRDTSLELSEDSKIHFKFLKAGMGFFCSGVANPHSETLKALELARLRGILMALQSLSAEKNQNEALFLTKYSKIKVIDLPYSGKQSDAEYGAVFSQLQREAESLGFHLMDSQKDALDPTVMPKDDASWIMATTNCADPHAMIGNEGGYESVDAAIATNADVQVLNPAFNPEIRCKTLLRDGSVVADMPSASCGRKAPL